MVCTLRRCLELMSVLFRDAVVAVAAATTATATAVGIQTQAPPTEWDPSWKVGACVCAQTCYVYVHAWMYVRANVYVNAWMYVRANV